MSVCVPRRPARSRTCAVYGAACHCTLSGVRVHVPSGMRRARTEMRNETGRQRFSNKFGFTDKDVQISSVSPST
eukprot:5179266-Prymnesium_polylepis.1